MIYPPLQHGFSHHLSDPRFTPGGQSVYVGTRPIDDGWVVAVIRIDDCTSEDEAVWLGARVRADLLTHLCFANQEAVPVEAVDVEHGVPADGAGWSVAVYVTLGSMRQAGEMMDFLRTYASPR